MAEEKKLGPNVTYLGNDENDKTPVTMGNVRFKPGESINLQERMPPGEAEATLKSLAGNRFFQVDGGPDHKAQRQKAAEEEALKAAGHQPADESQLDKPINKRSSKKPGEPTFE